VAAEDHKARQQERKGLRTALQSASDELSRVLHDFRQLVSELPSAIPGPDSIQRIQNAGKLRELAYRKYEKAQTDFDQFIAQDTRDRPRNAQRIQTMNLEEKERQISNLELPWAGLAESLRVTRDQQIKNIQEIMGNHEFTTELCEYQRQHYEDLLNKILELASRKPK
jgi:hypothetical protein